MRMIKAIGTAIWVTGIVLFFAWLANYRLDKIENAWAHASPPLMRTWLGDASAGGVRMTLVMRLERDDVGWIPKAGSHEIGRGFHGDALFCDSTGRTQAYTLRGVVADQRAAELSVTFSPPAGETPGLRPTGAKVKWDGANELDVRAWLARVLASGGTTVRSSDPLTGGPIEFAMRAATAFRCSIGR
jgi:hypothetical protein